MFTVTVGDYAITVQQGSIPTIYGDYKKHAKLADEFALRLRQPPEQRLLHPLRRPGAVPGRRGTTQREPRGAPTPARAAPTTSTRLQP